MFWGRICYSVKSDLVFCISDLESKKGGVTARIYKNILEEYLPTLIDPFTIFMQDNAPIYTSRLLRNWLQEMRFQVLDWPPYSPDLNPIENLWKLLKERIIAQLPRAICHAKERWNARFSMPSCRTSLAWLWNKLEPPPLDHPPLWTTVSHIKQRFQPPYNSTNPHSIKLKLYL